MNNKINIVFMGGFTYPNGMAGTKRIQNAISALNQYPHITTRVILQRQSSNDNILLGVYKGTPYETVMGDLFRFRIILSLPRLYYKTNAALKRALKPDHKNIIYFYGPLFFESVMPVIYAQRLGYKIVFDIVEDFELVTDLLRSPYEYAKSRFTLQFLSLIKKMADGIVVISSHLQKKYISSTQGKKPIHYMPISVDMDRFPDKPKPERMQSSISLIYAGTFGGKDGLPILLDAFDKLAVRYQNLHLVLVGRGSKESMDTFYARMERSQNKDRIEVKGYLDDDDYYSVLNDSDIPCMTRVDHPYAHAGFPFKLGEFLATSKPVIASRVSDVDSFLKHGHDAMLVQPGSSTEICNAAEFLIINPGSAKAIGMRGREVAKLFFDYKQQGKALLTFLENI